MRKGQKMKKSSRLKLSDAISKNWAARRRAAKAKSKGRVKPVMKGKVITVKNKKSRQ